MAFSAHNEMGQNERIETVTSTTSGPRSVDSESKFIPNPSAQPFVPKWNSSTPEKLNSYFPQNADCNASDQEITKNFADIRIMDRQIVNGEDHRCPPGPPSQHIALHLLSKVLDDETIFNLEESNNTPVETFLPLTVDPSIRPGDVHSSWLSPSPQPSPDPISKPEQQSSSFHGEHIWQNNADVNHNNSINTPITSPSPVPAHACWVIQSPTSSPGAYLGRSENGTPYMNGYDSLPSPQMSSSVESLGNGGFFGPQYCSPTIHDDWTHSSDTENSRRPELVEHVGSFDYNRVPPAHAPVNLVCLSGSWPQNGQTPKEYEKTEVETRHVKNGYSWKGNEHIDYQAKPIPFQRSVSCKSDDDSWIGRGKESLTSSSYPKQNPSTELHLRIDQCYEQLRYLEKERRKAEVEISKFWPTRRVSSGGLNVSTGRLHHSPSRIDKLLVDVQKEHAKVEALVGRIERIRHSPLSINISESVDEMMSCLRRLQSSRKDEISGSMTRNKNTTGMRSPDGRDIISLISAVRDLTLKTRGCRTAVWCASQLVLSEMIKTGVKTPRSRRSSSNSESGIESSPSPACGGVS